MLQWLRLNWFDERSGATGRRQENSREFRDKTRTFRKKMEMHFIQQLSSGCATEVFVGVLSRIRRLMVQYSTY